MTQQPSKADRIRKLLHLSNAEIAKRIGCRDSYVRAVRQRTSANGHPILDAGSRTWIEANPDYSAKAYQRVRADPVRYSRRLANLNRRFKERYHSDPEFRAKFLERQAARRKRREGARAS
jgi:hypothetical protein